MRRVVAEYLAPRLCRDAVSIVTTTMPVDDALALLRANLVWSLRYDHGRLLGELRVRELLEGGHLALARRWAEVAPYPRPMHRVLRGETLRDDELAACSEDDRIDVRLAQRCLRGEASPPAPLNEEPIQHLEDDPGDARHIQLYDYAATGDHDGCLRRLHAAIAHWSSEADARRAWPRLAALCRLLTDDDAAAMALLERAPLRDVHDDWIAIFGDAGVARIQRAKDHVLDAIERAFDGVPFPGKKHRSLFQAEAADNWAGCDQSRDHTGRWQDLPREHILACQFALSHLDAQGTQYYLPAVMSFIVREHDQRRADHGNRWIFESVEYGLAFALHDRGLHDYQQERYRLFTPAQLAAVAAFADYYRCGDEDRARWHALGRGEAWPPLAAT
jgi:hypothetical protein